MLRFFFIFFFILFNSSYSQTWDENFYDKKVLYDNADLLQLNEYEKLKIKSQELQRNRIVPDENVNFYDIENEVTVQKDDEKKNLIPKKKYAYFVDQIDDQSQVSTDNLTNENNEGYFIDF